MVLHRKGVNHPCWSALQSMDYLMNSLYELSEPISKDQVDYVISDHVSLIPCVSYNDLLVAQGMSVVISLQLLHNVTIPNVLVDKPHIYNC